jgi:hypothetical protein
MQSISRCTVNAHENRKMMLEYYWTTACSLIVAVFSAQSSIILRLHFSPQFPTLFDAVVTILHPDYRMEILEVEGAVILELGL